MDPSLRFINVSEADIVGAESWIKSAAVIQQQCYEKNKYSTWQFIKGKREILEMEVEEALNGSNSTGIMNDISTSLTEERVNLLTDVIYKQVYKFSEFRFGFIKPLNKYQTGSIKFPVFSVCASKHEFVIDQGGNVYHNRFHFMKVHQFRPFVHCYAAKTLKVHDFQALLNEVSLCMYQKPFDHQEANASSTCLEEELVKSLCEKIYENLCLTDDFAVSTLYIIGKENESNIHLPVVSVACNGNQTTGQSTPFYVDHIGRVYKNWKDYLANNIYPKCLLCCPRSGTYQADERNKVLLDITYSSACGIGKKVMLGIDLFGTSMTLISLGLGTILGPVTVGISAACGFAVGCNYLHDRRIHKQSLTGLDAASGWFSVAAGIAGFGGGAFSLAKGLIAGQQLTKEAEIAIKVCKFAAPKLKVAQNLTTYVADIRKRKMSLKGMKVTKEDVSNIFSYIKKTYIKLKNCVIKLSNKIKVTLVELWCAHFPHQEYSVIAESISSTISLSEKLDNHMKGCESESEYLDLAEFVTIYKANMLSKMEKEYLHEKNEMQVTLGNTFVESVFDEKWGIKGNNDRKVTFMKRVDDLSVKDLEVKYKDFSDKVPILNESDEIQFISNAVAINNCFRCCVSVDSELVPEEYFPLIRRVARDDKLIVNSEECDHGKLATYYDSSVPLTVRMLLIEKGKILLSTELRDWQKSDSME